MLAITKLKQELDAEKDTNISQQNDIEKLKRSIDMQRKTIKEMEEKIKFTKLAHNISDEHGNNLPLKRKVEAYIKEIDKCISILNE